MILVSFPKFSDTGCLVVIRIITYYPSLSRNLNGCHELGKLLPFCTVISIECCISLIFMNFIALSYSFLVLSIHDQCILQQILLIFNLLSPFFNLMLFISKVLRLNMLLKHVIYILSLVCITIYWEL